MRILTVRQPWAWAIIHGGKDVENRVRNVAGDYRGPIAIHAGLAPFEQGNMAGHLHKDMHGGEIDTQIVYGAIIGVVDIVDVHGVIETDGRFHCETVATPTVPEAAGACSRWAEKDTKHVVFANPRPLAEPIPYKGALGLRELPADVVARIEAAL